jgi:hypothetical protein
LQADVEGLAGRAVDDSLKKTLKDLIEAKAAVLAGGPLKTPTGTL